MVELFLPLAVGSLAFLSPCIVPMLTVYFSLITGLTAEELIGSSEILAIKRNIFKSTLFFIAGYSII
ncbi:MAG: cytochrome C biogenesis protein CcdA, partial [Actinobacteria bacterium]